MKKVHISVFINYYLNISGLNLPIDVISDMFIVSIRFIDPVNKRKMAIVYICQFLSKYSNVSIYK